MGGKEECFANEVDKCGRGPLGGRVSATTLCHQGLNQFLSTPLLPEAEITVFFLNM